MFAQAFFPPLKIDRAAERREHHKLGKGDARTLCQFLRRFECIWTVGRESENE
jgi:hypothetical protein